MDNMIETKTTFGYETNFDPTNLCKDILHTLRRDSVVLLQPDDGPEWADTIEQIKKLVYDIGLVLLQDGGVYYLIDREAVVDYCLTW